MLTTFATIHSGKKQRTACDFKREAIHPPSEIGRCLGLKPEGQGHFVLKKEERLRCALISQDSRNSSTTC